MTTAEDDLHERRAHPDYEYATTECERKVGDVYPPEGEGWVDNPRGSVARWTDSEGVYHEDARPWERFDFHEEHHWMRLRPARERGESDAQSDVVDPFDPRVTVSIGSVSVTLDEGVDFTRDGSTITLHTSIPLRLRFEA